MKMIKTAIAILGVAYMLIASEGAFAAHVGVYIGIPLGVPAYPYYGPYAPYYYPPPVTVIPAAPSTYIVQPPPVENSTPSQYWWYYCPDSKAYYPYVKNCPGGWQRVAPQPPNQ